MQGINPWLEATTDQYSWNDLLGVDSDFHKSKVKLIKGTMSVVQFIGITKTNKLFFEE